MCRVLIFECVYNVSYWYSLLKVHVHVCVQCTYSLCIINSISSHEATRERVTYNIAKFLKMAAVLKLVGVICGVTSRVDVSIPSSASCVLHTCSMFNLSLKTLHSLLVHEM